MSKKLKIICDGDSWVFGCEIVDPELKKKYGGPNIHPGAYDYFEENDEYRVPKIFPTFLSEIMDADVTNLSWPADDNGTILNRTITYITTNYINKGLPTDDLFVIIGWSSPERNVFWYKDDEISRRFRLWPQVKHFDAPVQEEFWKFYVTYLWNPEEYLPRYIMNVLQLQNFCEVNNIKWMCFNSFYQTPAMNVEQWYDLDIKTELSNLRLDGAHIYNTELKRRLHHQFEYNSIWESINNVRFYKKDVKNNTFKSFIESKECSPIYIGWHPSPESHKVWAEELANYIKENNLLKNIENEKFSNMRGLI